MYEWLKVCNKLEVLGLCQIMIDIPVHEVLDCFGNLEVLFFFSDEFHDSSLLKKLFLKPKLKLKTLFVSSIYGSSEFIDSIWKMCPNLETLSLDDCVFSNDLLNSLFEKTNSLRNLRLRQTAPNGNSPTFEFLLNVPKKILPNIKTISIRLHAPRKKNLVIGIFVVSSLTNQVSYF